MFMRSVVRAARPKTPVRPALAARTLRAPSHRPLHASAAVSAEKDPNPSASADSLDTEAADATPWYLREDLPQTQPSDVSAAIPVLPETAPPQLAQLAQKMADYGIADLQVFDLTVLPPDHPHNSDSELYNYVLIGTAKSEKHVYKAASELRLDFKHSDQNASIEGLVSTTPSATARRRALRRPNKGPISTDNDFGKSANSWVMCCVESVQMHILTADRREQLDLESLWSEDYVEEQYAPAAAARSGTWAPSRRFHTSTRRFDAVANYNALLEAELPLTCAQVREFVSRFEHSQPQTLEDHRTRFNFYRALHLVDPETVAFADVAKAVLDKYDDLRLVSAQPDSLDAERATDAGNLVKLLIDSPEFKYVDKAAADKAHHALAQLVQQLYQFSGVQLDYGANAEFLPLLLRLSFMPASDGLELGPKVVDEFIDDAAKFAGTKFATAVEASNRTRDVLALVDDYTRTHGDGRTLSYSVRELVLFSYGNAAKWDRFWAQWEVALNLLGSQPKAWVRLVVYLGLRADPVANAHFLGSLWRNSSSVSGSFTQFYEAHAGSLTASEVAAVKSSLGRIVASVPASSRADEVRAFIEA